MRHRKNVGRSSPSREPRRRTQDRHDEESSGSSSSISCSSRRASGFGTRTRTTTAATPPPLLWLVAVFLLTLLGGCVRVTDASIRLPDAASGTNKKYSSALDSRGKQLWKGYDYFARLQHIPGELCLNGDNVNKTVVPSADHLPIALIVKSGGGCTLEENIMYIAQHVVPEGHVGFLIVDTPAMMADQTPAPPAVSEKKPTVWGAVAATLFGSTLSSSWSSSSPHGVVQNPHHKRHSNGDDVTPEFPFFILHVSFDAEFDLLDAVYHQDDDTRSAGGPRITVDAKSASSPYWIAIAAVLAACVCSFCIIFQSWLEVEQADLTPVPPRPTNQRRLTRQQVRQLLPTYRYDGCSLHSMAAAAASDGDDLESGSTPPPPPPLTDVMMDCCSICLDDYESGDVLRVLACQHVYHAKCIGKWLVERSAVCPLCKEDLFVEEEEEPEEEEEEEEVAEPQRPSQYEESMWRRIYQSLTATADQDDTDVPQQPETADAEATAAGELQPPAIVDDMVPSSSSSSDRRRLWWSRMFFDRRRPIPQAESSDLAQPLLAAAAAENEQDPEAIVDNDDYDNDDDGIVDNDEQQEMTVRQEDTVVASATATATAAAQVDATAVDQPCGSNESLDNSIGNDADAMPPVSSAEGEQEEEDAIV
jgi:Ring finger domain